MSTSAFEPFPLREESNLMRVVSYDPALSQRRHAHDYASLTLMLGGGLEESVGRSTRRAGLGWMCLKTPGVHHACRFGATVTRTLQVRLAPEELPSGMGDGLAMPHWAWHAPGRLMGEMLALRRLNSAPPSTGRSAAIADGVQDILAAFAVSHRAEYAHRPAWLPRICDALADGDETIAELARQCGVHRVYFARCFRQHVGLAPARYRRMMRVLRAVNAVRQDQAALAGIAAAEGFADQSHMIREVRAETGLTPLTWRRLAG